MSEGVNQNADMTPEPSPSPSSSGSCTCTPPCLRLHMKIEGAYHETRHRQSGGCIELAAPHAPVRRPPLRAVEVEHHEDVERVEAQIRQGEARRDTPIQGRGGQEEVGQHLEEDVAGESLCIWCRWAWR